MTYPDTLRATVHLKGIDIDIQVPRVVAKDSDGNWYHTNVIDTYVKAEMARDYPDFEYLGRDGLVDQPGANT